MGSLKKKLNSKKRRIRVLELAYDEARTEVADLQLQIWALERRFNDFLDQRQQDSQLDVSFVTGDDSGSVPTQPAKPC